MTDIEVPLSEGINGFKPTSWAAPVEDLAAEYDRYDREHTELKGEMTQEEAHSEGLRLVKKGRLNPVTGQEIPLSPKAQTISRFIPSRSFKENYERMNWSVQPVNTRL